MMLAAVAPATADDHCERPDAIEVAGLYIDDRGDPYGTGFITGGGTWLYMESNGVPGMQLTNGNDPSGLFNDPDGADCENGDTLIL
ncbi:MAG: hypothetical protein ACPGQL_07280 [Thermoplasmatota archaeon]